MKMVGYSVSCHDNDTYMFDLKKFDTGLPHCLKCGYRLDFEPTSSKYKLGRPSKDSADCLYPAARKSYKYDLSCTYDGQTIASKAFKIFCEKNEYAKDLLFKEFEKDKDHFHLIAKKKIKFDAERSKTRFE